MSNKRSDIFFLLILSFCLAGCLPTLHIDGEFTVEHHVVHSVNDKEQGDKEVSVRQLKVMGLVGERYDGYLAAVVPEVDEKIRTVIDTVNSERREKYEGITARIPGATVADIEKQAGQALIKRESSGFFVMDADKGWRKK